MAYYLTGHQTETAGTEIVSVCPPNSDMIPVMTGFSYTPAGTSHNLYMMSPLGKTATSSFTSSTDTTMELAKPDAMQTSAGVDETLAASDFVAFRDEFGVIQSRKVSSISGSTITITAPDNDVPEGETVWLFGELDRFSTKKFRALTGSTLTLENLNVQSNVPNQDGVQISYSGSSAPALLVSDNVTAAGQMEWVQWTWIPASEAFAK